MSTNEPMTQERLDAIQARTDAAQNTPWQRGEDEPMFSSDDYMSTVNGHDGDPVGYCPDCGVHAYYSAQIADLIAHAPQDLTDLIAEVERLRARLTVDDDMIRRANDAAGQGLGYWESSDLEGVYGEGKFLTADALRAALGTQEDA